MEKLKQLLVEKIYNEVVMYVLLHIKKNQNYSEASASEPKYLLTNIQN